jgi:hypothetical protein
LERKKLSGKVNGRNWKKGSGWGKKMEERKESEKIAEQKIQRLASEVSIQKPVDLIKTSEFSYPRSFSSQRLDVLGFNFSYLTAILSIHFLQELPLLGGIQAFKILISLREILPAMPPDQSTVQPSGQIIIPKAT